MDFFPKDINKKMIDIKNFETLLRCLMFFYVVEMLPWSRNKIGQHDRKICHPDMAFSTS